MHEKLLPVKTVERLCKYRRVLLHQIKENVEYIYSKELAKLTYSNSVQVRYDLMLIGHNAIPGKGYSIKDLVISINKKMEKKSHINAAIIGMGRIGQACLKYFNDINSKARIVATFDNDPEKTNCTNERIQCYPVSLFRELALQKKIQIGIIATNKESAEEVKELLIDSHIKGIINLTTMPLNVPDYIYLEELDLSASLEKAAYFIRNMHSESVNRNPCFY